MHRKRIVNVMTVRRYIPPSALRLPISSADSVGDKRLPLANIAPLGKGGYAEPYKVYCETVIFCIKKSEQA